jgi:hypothetical protein
MFIQSCAHSRLEERTLSLSKIGSKVKSGVSDLTHGNVKSIAMNLGIGAALGAIVALILRAIQLFVINKAIPDYAKYDEFSIYPNGTSLYVEDVILILATVGLLLSKKLWLVLGFFLGWYGSNYMGLYDALSLPKPTT